MATKIEMRGWGNVKAVAAYAGVSERTVEDWLKKGLRYTQLPSGYRLIKFDWMDAFLDPFATNAGAAKKKLDHIVEEVYSKVRIQGKSSMKKALDN